jgi:hypothetical protein
MITNGEQAPSHPNQPPNFLRIEQFIKNFRLARARQQQEMENKSLEALSHFREGGEPLSHEAKERIRACWDDGSDFETPLSENQPDAPANKQITP